MPLHDHAIAFDLDGTLVDTAPDLVRALNACLEGSAVQTVSVDDVRPLIGQGAQAMIERAFARSQVHPGTGEVQNCLEVFLHHYSAHLADHSQPFAGALDCLEELRNAGASFRICTNKPRALTHKLLQALDLAQVFEAIVCPEDVAARKPDAAHVLAAIAPHAPRRALMVGDSINDLQAARAAGVAAILLSHGYSDTPAHDLGADLVLDHFAALADAIFAHFGPGSDGQP